MDFSLFALPVQTQNVYRIILMVPLGALVIVVLRNLIGLATFRTFMPILVAMAFGKPR
ncbi:MAG: 7TM domain-containing protein [Gammaproteobacteria bacterium]